MYSAVMSAGCLEAAENASATWSVTYLTQTLLTNHSLFALVVEHVSVMKMLMPVRFDNTHSHYSFPLMEIAMQFDLAIWF